MRAVHRKDYQRFLSLLLKARNDAGLTQSEVAKALGHPQSYVSKYERGERRLDAVEFLEVAKALGIDPYKVLRTIEKRLRLRVTGSN